MCPRLVPSPTPAQRFGIVTKSVYKAKTDIGRFQDGRERLFVQFSESKGEHEGSLEWTPAWNDVRELLVNAVEVERRNTAGSSYLEQFAQACSEVIAKYAPAQDVKLVLGRCSHYRVDPEVSKAFVNVRYREVTDGPDWIAGDEEWELAFPLTEAGLQDLMFDQKEIKWLVWDGKVVRLGE